MDHGRALRTGGGRRRGLGALLLLTCVEEEGRRGGGEAPWRGRRELFAWCSAEPRRWGRDCAEEVGGGLVAIQNTERRFGEFVGLCRNLKKKS